MVSISFVARLLYLLLACIGLTFIVKYGTILDIPRNWVKSRHAKLDELFSCSLCLGFWSGCVIGITNKLYLLPLCSAGVCWVSDMLLDVINPVQTPAE